jgi:hypothetical protein
MNFAPAVEMMLLMRILTVSRLAVGVAEPKIHVEIDVKVIYHL